MLLILASWLLLALATTTLGWSAWRALAAGQLATDTNQPGPATAPPLPAELLSLAGVALLLMGLAPVSLLLPLGGLAVRGTLALLVAGLLLGQRRALAAEARHWWATPRPAAWWAGAGLLGLLLLALLFYQQGSSHAYDEQLYYLQSLQWLERFAVVPGLGNLHGRLAFNSHLFLGTAALAIPTPTGTYYPLPPYLSTLLAAAAARGVGRGRRAGTGPTLGAGAALLLFGAYFYVFRAWLPSPAPDCAIIVFLLFIFLLYSGFLGAFDVRGPAGRGPLLLLALLSCVAVTIKLSALPILLLPLHALWVIHRPGSAGQGISPGRKRRIWLALLGLATIIFLPWMVRNLLLSGYPVYPLPGLPGLPVDWRMPPELVLTEQRLITNMARNMLAADKYGPVDPSWWRWLPRWWQQEVLYALVTPALLLLAAAAPLVAFWQARRTAAPFGQPGWLSSWLVALVGGLFWFTLAPDYRFGAGFLLALALWPWLPLPLPRWLGVLGLAVMAAGMLQLLREPLYGLRHPRPGAVAGLLWPTLPPLPPTRPVRLPGGQVVRVAVGELGPCGKTPLPCTHAIVPGLEFRGNSLAQGFRVRSAAAQR